MTWKTKFGASQQAAVKLTTIDPKSPSQGVLLKVQAGSIATAGAISVVYDAPAKAVRVSTLREIRFAAPMKSSFRRLSSA